MASEPAGERLPDPYGWLVGGWQWPYAAAFAACFLLALLPIAWSELGVAAMLVYAQLPAYLLHQLEEHRGDCFRVYVNRLLGGGVGRGPIFAVNLLAVWALILAAFYLAYYVNPAWGLVAVYLTGFNALTHVAVALRRREYNPGLATALALFGPLSVWGAIEVNSAYAVSTAVQLGAIGVAIGGHLAIIAFLLGARRADPAPVARFPA